MQPPDSPPTLLTFPCRYSIKVMGKAEAVFEPTIYEILKRHIPQLSPDLIKTRPSKNGQYTAITATFEAQSKEQLDALYQEISHHPLVLMAL